MMSAAHSSAIGHRRSVTHRFDLDEIHRERLDREIEQDAAHRLRHSGYAVLTGVTCQCNQGVLTLSGTMPSFYLKQMAQEIARRLVNVDRVVNRIKVSTAGPQGCRCS